MMVILAVFLMIVFYCLPLPLKIILTILNSIIPDSIPIIDELVMTSGTFAHIMRILKVSNFEADHPKFTKFVIAVLVLLILAAICGGVYYIFFYI